MKKIFFIFSLMLLPIWANADSVEIDGIFYNLSEKSSQAEVVSNPQGYSGKIEIPENVVYDGKSFNVNSIGENAFYGCGDLTSITIPSSVTFIGENAFDYCNGLVSVVIPTSVTSINNRVFYYCKGLASVTIPNSIISIGEHAFDGCSSLASIEIPNSVKTIGNSAFRGCSLSEIYIPNSVTSIENAAFSKCDGLKSVHISDLKAWCNIVFRGSYYCNPLVIAHHLYLNGEEVKDLIIPDGVTSLTGSFDGCKYLNSVTLPNSLTNIGDYAFNACHNLTSFIIPNSVTSIGRFAFSQCYALTSMIIPNNVATIGDGAFAHCYDLKSINIPDLITTISPSTFKDCTSLSSLMIPSSVTSIGNGAFMNCNFTSLTIPSSITFIDYSAFFQCNLTTVNITDLSAWCKIEFVMHDSNPLYYAQHLYLNGEEIKDLFIPDGVTSISKNTFCGFSELKSLTIPKSVTSIEKDAFSECSNLSNVYCYPNDVPNTSEDAFLDSPISNAKLWVPQNSLNEYKTIKPWSRFGSIVELTTDGLTQSFMNEIDIQYRENSLMISGLNEGLNITIHDISGKVIGSEKVSSREAVIPCPLRQGDVIFLKIGEKTLKTIIK